MVNLKDNVINSDFKLENFIDIDEAKDYLGELPGIKDIVFTIEEIFAAIGKFAGEIMKIINSILELFNIQGLFDSLGLNKLFDFIFGYVGGMMGGFGFSAGTREDIRNSFTSSCLSFNDSLSSKFGQTTPNIQMLSLIGVLMAMFCNGIDKAYSGLYSLFNDKDIMPEPELKNMFASTVGGMTKMPNTKSISAVQDISSSPFSDKVILHNPSIATDSLKYLNSDTTKHKDKAKTYDMVVGSISTMDDSFGYDNNISIFTGASKFRNLATGKNLSKVNSSLISNPTGTSGDLDLSVLSLIN